VTAGFLDGRGEQTQNGRHRPWGKGRGVERDRFPEEDPAQGFEGPFDKGDFRGLEKSEERGHGLGVADLAQGVDGRDQQSGVVEKGDERVDGAGVADLSQGHDGGELKPYVPGFQG
jgi:hypothetical protein